MWLDRLATHAPVMAVSVGLAASLAVVREWRSSGRSRPQPTVLRRSRSALMQAVFASLGAVVSSGAMEPLGASWPWLVVSLGAMSGVTVDVASANGPQRIADMSLRYLSRVRRIMREP